MKKLHAIVAMFAAGFLAPGLAAARIPPALPGDSVYQLPATLQDTAGREVAFSELRGQPRLVAFFYANCRYACPLIIETMRSIERKLPAAELDGVGFVLISMDPAHDTPGLLREVAKTRRLDPARWTLLRPQASDLRALAGVLGLRYRELADGEFNHTTPIVLLDAEGRVVARNEQLGGEPPVEFLAAVQRVSPE